MEPEMVERLLALNREFYQSHAAAFRDSRGRPQPGVLKALTNVGTHDRVLDVGCGHGLVATHLKERGFEGRYVGLDSSGELISMVPDGLWLPEFRFLVLDLTDSDWLEKVRTLRRSVSPESGSIAFGVGFAFAVLHHVPSAALRSRVVRNIRGVMAPGGSFIVSVWDFPQSPRLVERVIPWSDLEVDEAMLEPGDTLLDWRRGAFGVRYVHHFGSGELRELGQSAGFAIVDEYRSDGENGRLGLYQVWES